MKTLYIEGQDHQSTIVVGDSIQNLDRYVHGARTVIVTDSNVSRLYGSAFPKCPVLEIGLGEKNKTLDTVSSLLGRLMDLGADRSCFILGIGGGVVCDIAGFVASVYLRGVDFGFCPTTLLAQVDASVGGKNGVNHSGFKNMVGVFNQPSFVLCDPEVLKTLDPDELANGFAEMVKHGAIRDAGHFVFLEDHAKEALDLDEDVMTTLIHDSIAIKADVVNQDEREKGLRRILNFGHTFGHALEKVAGVPHGQAVSAGMVLACELSCKRGLLDSLEAGRIKSLLERLCLPASIPADHAKVVEALSKDKKRRDASIHFVLLERIGKAVVKSLSLEELSSFRDR